MNNLEQTLSAIQAESLSCFQTMDKEHSAFCLHHQTLFQRAFDNKPDKPVTHHLLGVLTKAHIEQSALLTDHSNAIAAMQKSIVDNLGDKHASKFENQSINQLLFTTHLWLYVQGYLSMDFSLANDHALNTADIITTLNGQDRETLRSEFMGSFYQGKQNSPKRPTENPFLRWFNRFFGT